MAAAWSVTDRCRRRRPTLLLACVCVALLVAAVGAQDVPHIQGQWKVTYKFVEMKGDKNMANACKGPFPYQYSWTYEICQAKGQTAYTAIIAGAESTTTRSRTLARASPNEIISKCKYRPTVQGPAGLTQDWKKLQAPGYPEDQEWQKWKPKDEKNQDTEPRTFASFQLPITPDQQSTFVWGDVCFQYDWQDTAENKAGFPYYKGAWRHENETWIFVRDPRNCAADAGSSAALEQAKKLDSEGGCLEKAVGTTIMRTKDNSDACLISKGIDVDKCPYSLLGVSGGPVLYDEEITGVPKTSDGRTNFCFMYSQITGTLIKSAADVEVQCGQGGAGKKEEKEIDDLLLDGADAESGTSPAGGTSKASQPPGTSSVVQSALLILSFVLSSEHIF